jgi:membrane protease YdiL (CAAX protease family)
MWPLWAAIVSAVAVAEELVLRGSLFTLLERACGPFAAVALTAIAFALLHVPLYGWGVVPIDLAVGVWLGGLRLLTGGPAAPAVTHVLADLASWWLL